MSQKSGPCRLLNTPKGCHFGNRCKFSHDRSASSRASPSPASSPARSRSQTPAPQSPRSPGKPPSGTPRNACQYFWNIGACARGFECSYRHVKKGGTEEGSDAATAAQADEDAILDFFSPEGLAVSAGSVREERHNLNPSDVHNHLKEFLRDNYHFDSAAQVQGFVRIIASVNDRNKSWVRVECDCSLAEQVHLQMLQWQNTESAQEFLQAVVKVCWSSAFLERFTDGQLKGNALHRLGDILRFQPVDVSIGFHTGALSFQRGYFPIFQFFASDLVLKSTLHRNIK